MKLKSKLKLFSLTIIFSNFLFAASSFAYYPRDNFQQMEEFVHNRDLIRNLKQVPYKTQFNIPEEESLFFDELNTPGSGHLPRSCTHCNSKKCNSRCNRFTNSNSEFLNMYLQDYSGGNHNNYNYDYSSYWPY